MKARGALWRVEKIAQQAQSAAEATHAKCNDEERDPRPGEVAKLLELVVTLVAATSDLLALTDAKEVD